MSFLEEFQQKSETELKHFLFLCGQKDREILFSKNKKDKIGEFARLACITLVFDFRRMFLKILADIEIYIKVFMNNLDAVTFIQLDEWMIDFIENIENEEAQTLVREVWQDRKPSLDREDFSVRSILKR